MTTTTSLADRLRAALPAALRAHDRAAVAALRGVLAAIDNAAAVPPQVSPLGLPTAGLGATEVARRVVDDAEMADILRTEVAQRLAAASGYDGLGHPDRAERLRREAEVLAAHLPAS